jgi:hypothetical protein
MTITPTEHPSAYWWFSRPNFGDALAPYLLHRFSDRMQVVHAPMEHAQILSIGSVLDRVPADWGGVVLGSGMLREDSQPDLGLATVLALRGPLTAKACALPVGASPALGDPGLLANELVSLPDKEHELGLVPHWSDTELEHREEFAKLNPLVIRVGHSPLDVVRQIGSCRKIVASSLHGIILADAFGIPRRIELGGHERLAREGGDFKYRDYHAAIDTPYKPGEAAVVANTKAIQDRQSELFDAYKELGALFRGK